MDKDIFVTLERPVTIPQGMYEPAQVRGFYARDYQDDDRYFTFFGVTVEGDRTAAITVRKANIRGITYLQPKPEDDDAAE